MVKGRSGHSKAELAGVAVVGAVGGCRWKGAGTGERNKIERLLSLERVHQTV